MNDHIDLREYDDWLSARINLYRLLGRLYLSEVDPAMLQEMIHHGMEMAEGDSPLVEGYHQMQRYLQNASEITLTELAVDYTRVFIAPDRDGAYPYESVYTSEEHLLMQSARDQVVEIYRQAGLQRAPEFNEPEDQLGFELEFIGEQGRAAWEALRQGDRAAGLQSLTLQKDFIETHLQPWVPKLCADILRKAKTDFYRGLARMTTGFLELDDGILNEIIDAVRSPGAE